MLPCILPRANRYQLLRRGVLVNPDGSIQCSGAYILQLMPGYDEQIIGKLERRVLKAESVTDMLRKDLVPKRC